MGLEDDNLDDLFTSSPKQSPLKKSGRGVTWTKAEHLAIVQAWQQVDGEPRELSESSHHHFNTRVYRRFVELCPDHQKRTEKAVYDKMSVMRSSYIIIHNHDISRNNINDQYSFFYSLPRREQRNILRTYKVGWLDEEIYVMLHPLMQNANFDNFLPHHIVQRRLTVPGGNLESINSIVQQQHQHQHHQIQHNNIGTDIYDSIRIEPGDTLGHIGMQNQHVFASSSQKILPALQNRHLARLSENISGHYMSPVGQIQPLTNTTNIIDESFRNLNGMNEEPVLNFHQHVSLNQSLLIDPRKRKRSMDGFVMNDKNGDYFNQDNLIEVRNESEELYWKRLKQTLEMERAAIHDMLTDMFKKQREDLTKLLKIDKVKNEAKY